MVKRFLIVSAFLLTAIIGAACNEVKPGTIALLTSPRSWIDVPLDGSTIPLAPIDVISHSTDPMKIVAVELSVNGAVFRTDPNTDTTATLATTRQQWVPPAPGDYTLQVRAQNSASIWGDYASKVVTVAGAAAPVKPPLPPAPLPVVPSPVPTVPPTLGAAPSALPAVGIAFSTDKASLALGQCATIRWQVTNASQVFLDNASVNPSGSKQDCPTQNTTHTLRVVTLDKQTVQRTLTINVVVPTRTVPPPPPPPQTGCSGTPNIASFSASPSSISAGGSSTLSWGAVTNADSVVIDQGIGGVAAPGSTSVSPGGTTTYTLTAHCGNNAASKQVMVSVTGAPPPLPQPPTFGNALWDQPKFYFNSGKCGTRQVTISVSSPNANSVQIYLRAADQDGGASTGWISLPMSGSGTWSRPISDADIPGITTITKKWFQFYFAASNAAGQTQSQQYLNSVELWYCAGIS